MGQKVDEFLGQSVAEVVVVWITTHVGEREHGDGRLPVGRPDHDPLQCGCDVRH